MAVKEHPGLILLDLRLPDITGLTVLETLHTALSTKNIPIIVVSAISKDDNVAKAMQIGAFDYIIKPISMHKLLARIKLALRKAPVAGDLTAEIMTFGSVVIDAAQYSVTIANQPVPFTKKEFEILLYLVRRPGRVISRENLLNELWGDEVVVIDRTIDVHIRKIREKLGDTEMRHIETIKGVGYRFITGT